MTEREYIDISELQIVRIMVTTLRHICIENSSVIDKKEYQEVMGKLCDWQEKLFQKIEIEVGNG